MNNNINYPSFSLKQVKKAVTFRQYFLSDTAWYSLPGSRRDMSKNNRPGNSPGYLDYNSYSSSIDYLLHENLIYKIIFYTKILFRTIYSNLKRHIQQQKLKSSLSSRKKYISTWGYKLDRTNSVETITPKCIAVGKLYVVMWQQPFFEQVHKYKREWGNTYWRIQEEDIQMFRPT